jgi:hypothetical protein
VIGGFFHSDLLNMKDEACCPITLGHWLVTMREVNVGTNDPGAGNPRASEA